MAKKITMDSVHAFIAEKEYPKEGEDSTYCDLGLVQQYAFVQGAKWQQEQLYSEEEVINLLKALQLYKLVHTERIDIEKWLEKFKNK